MKHKLDGRKHDVSSMRALQLMKGTTGNIFLLNKVIIFSLFRPGNSVEKIYKYRESKPSKDTEMVVFRK